MSVSILVDGRKLFLNPFITTLTSNLMEAIARSLKMAGTDQQIEIAMKDEEIRLFYGKKEISLSQGQAHRIIGNILKGLLQSLHGTESGREFQFYYEPDHHDISDK